MESIRELISLLSRNKLDQIELVGTGGPSLTNQLYEAIKNEEVSTDEDAAKLIYKSKPTSYKYRKLKTRLKNKLLASLFFIDTSKAYSLEIERAYHHCVKTYSVVSLLITKAVRNTAIDLAEKALIQANKYEFTELGMAFCRILTGHYGQIEKNEEKYFKYRKLLDEKLKTLSAELTAEKHNYEILSKTLNSKTYVSYYDSDEFKKRYKEIRSIIDECQTHAFLRNAYKILFTYSLHRKKYHELIRLSKEAVRKLELKPYETINIRFTFGLYSILANLQLSNYQIAETEAKEYLNIFSPDKYNWYVTQYYLFIAYTHSRKYTQAYTTTNEVVNNKYFKKLPNAFQQNWLVHEAFMQLLSTIGKVEKEKENITESNFRIYKFLNEIPIYSKDKRGLNISILIIHVLFLLQKNKKSEIIDRVDALNQYCHRYLRRDDTFRSNCFIKMLLQIPRADFNRIRTERYAEKYRSKLNEMPINVADQGIEIEIIPYEDLWDIVLELLDD